MKRFVIGSLVIGVAVLLAYFSALQLGFYGDDWIFYDLAGRLSFSEYLVKYLDPNAQTAWYRPVQGILWRIGYTGFGTNTFGYHLVNVLLHLANCILLFAILRRVTRSERIGFIAALIFATLPTAVLSVLWPGVVDTLVTFFYLLAIWFWIVYVMSLRGVHPERSGAESKDRATKQSPINELGIASRSTSPLARKPLAMTQAYSLAFGAFILALLSKEISVTLPITLFLIDRFVVAKPATIAQLIRRYAPFVIAWMVYLPIEYIVTRRSVFVNREGYSLGATVAENLVAYLSTLAFPWVFAPPFSYVWLAIVAAILAYLIVWRKYYALLPIIVGATLAILPVTPFPFVGNRFLYLPLVGFAIVFACVCDFIAQRQRVITMVVVAGIALFGSLSIARATADFAENGRVARVPFRNARQAHPKLPDDTFVYFINPPLPGPNLSGMFLWQYGTRVFASANDVGGRANLRDHAAAYVYYFDDQGNQKEIRVEKEITARGTPTPPIEFAESIRLEGYELVNANVKRGDAIVLLLYWRAHTRIENDFVAVVNLVAADGRVVAQHEKMPTTGWFAGELVVEAVQLPIQVAPGAYRLEIGSPQAPGVQLSIAPINVIE